MGSQSEVISKQYILKTTWKDCELNWWWNSVQVSVITNILQSSCTTHSNYFPLWFCVCRCHLFLCYYWIRIQLNLLVSIVLNTWTDYEINERTEFRFKPCPALGCQTIHTAQSQIMFPCTLLKIHYFLKKKKKFNFTVDLNYIFILCYINILCTTSFNQWEFYLSFTQSRDYIWLTWTKVNSLVKF